MTEKDSQISTDPLAVEIVNSDVPDSSDIKDVSVGETSRTQITTYVDAAAHVTVERPMVTPDSLWVGANTLPNQELLTVMSRSYELGVTSWAPATVGTDLTGYSNLDVMTTLLAIPQIAEKIKYFKYFRCRGVNITIRINATPWHYGCLVVSSTVNDTKDYQNFPSIYSRTFMNNNAVLMDANSMEAVDYFIPWCLPFQWVDTYAPPVNSMSLRLTPIVEISMIGTSLVDAQVTVYANFVDPEVCFPVASSLFPSGQTLATYQVHSESKRVEKNKEARVKSEKNSMAGDFTTVIDTTLDTLSDVTSVAAKVAPLLALLDKPTSLSAVSHVVQLPGTSMPHTCGLDTPVKLGACPEASAGFSEGSLGDMVGNPSVRSLVQTPAFLQTFQWDTTTTAGNLIASQNLSPIAMTYANTTGTNAYYTPTYAFWYSQLYRYWRGGIKFWLHFVGSTFMTSRIRIVWFPEGYTAPTSLTLNETGDYISQVVEVTGSMDVEFMIPYVSSTVYRNVGTGDTLNTRLTTVGNSTIGIIGVYLVTAAVSVNSTITPTMNCVWYGSMAEDIQYSNLSTDIQTDGTTNYKFAPTTYTAFTAVNQVFEKSFDSLVPYTTSVEFGLATSEQEYDLCSIGKRYSISDLYPNIANSNYYQFDFGAWEIPNDSTGFANMLQAWVTACHVNFRGSWRLKVFWPDNTSDYTTPIFYGSMSAPAVGTWLMQQGPTFATGAVGNDFAEVEVPWNFYLPWHMRGAPTAPELSLYAKLPVTNASTLVPVGNVCISFGDDFGMGILQSPPVIGVGSSPLARLPILDVPTPWVGLTIYHEKFLSGVCHFNIQGKVHEILSFLRLRQIKYEIVVSNPEWPPATLSTIHDLFYEVKPF